MSKTPHRDIRNAMIETCREMNSSGLNQGTSGNLSHRIEGGMLVTPTSLPYERMEPEDIVEMAFDGTFQGRHRPSSEWRFHRDILKSRPDVNIVLHTHSVYSTTLAVHEKGIPAFHYMVAVAGGTDIRCSPYACFGTQDLSDVAISALEDRLACLLGHHGLIVLADTFEKALWRAVEVETLAKMYVHALAIAEPPRLSEADMQRVIEQIRRMGYGQAPDLDDVDDSPKPKGSKAKSAKAKGGKAKAEAAAPIKIKAIKSMKAGVLKTKAKAPLSGRRAGAAAIKPTAIRSKAARNRP